MGMTVAVSLHQLKECSLITFERVMTRADRSNPDFDKYWKYLNLGHILLKQLESEAPGTMRHSLMVANIAGASASHIKGTNPDFARCIAYYHDIFKGKYPHLFFEAMSGLRNKEGQRRQIEINSLDDLNIVMSHANGSALMLRAEGFPEEVCRGVSEHHGDMFTLVNLGPDLQYLLNDPKLRNMYLRYRGPRPTSKESAIVMLADRCEAVLNRKSTETDWPINPGYDLITEWVKDLSKDVRSRGQLINSGLSVEEQAIVEYKIAWWLFRYYNNLDITGTPSTKDLLAVEEFQHNR
jgi:cyclic-di-AMP phosphodiesterase PgpH